VVPKICCIFVIGKETNKDMATGAKIVLVNAGWRIKPEFIMHTNPHASRIRKDKHISGKIARAKFKAETSQLVTEID